MKNYFYNLNSKYLKAFKQNVLNMFESENIKTNEIFLKHIFKEINNLFSRIGGRVSTKKDIPKKGEYPDSNKFNRLLENIDDDLDKLYTAQTLVEDDLNNLMKFNASQRTTTFEHMLTAQQKIMSLYIKNKKDINGEIIIENNFQSSESASSDSENIHIDEIRGLLTLSSENKIVKPIDTTNVYVYFTGTKPKAPIYPAEGVFGTGSFWRIPDLPAAHHIDPGNPSDVENYKLTMIDSPNSNNGIGWVEFESVLTELIGHVQPIERREYTFLEGGNITTDSYIPNYKTTFPNKDLLALKEEISKISGLNNNVSDIYIDVGHSLHGNLGYVKRVSSQNIETSKDEMYKLVIPFTATSLTNEIYIKFNPIESDIPIILWSRSKVYSKNDNIGTDLVPPSDTNLSSNDGQYICKIAKYIVPSRLELILTYGGNAWHEIPFQMTHYAYSVGKQYTISDASNSPISLFLNKQYDVFVDSEANKRKEKDRALGVITGIR